MEKICRKLHYVKVPENHIIIDFDIPDENRNKRFERNLDGASDVKKLSRIYGDSEEGD